MTCSPFDIRDYFLDELSLGERRAVDQHLPGCTGCREELSALQLTGLSLRSVADEEPPRRLAFVSDKVFAPRWWNVLWNSGARLGFASAALLAAAIVVHAFYAPPVPVAAITAVASESEVQSRIETAVRKAVAESETRQQAQLKLALAERDRRMEIDRKSTLIALDQYTTYLRNRMQTVVRASMNSSSVMQ